jgi:hypothetical protein
MPYSILVAVVALIGLTVFLIKLSQHKYDNLLHLAAIGILTYGTIAKGLGSQSQQEWNMVIGFGVYCISFLIVESSRFLFMQKFVNSNKHIISWNYVDFEVMEVGIKQPVYKNVVTKMTYKNGSHLSMSSSYLENTRVETYYTDYDTVLTVVTGELVIHRTDRDIKLTAGETVKLYAFSPISVTGFKGTVVHSICVKPKN